MKDKIIIALDTQDSRELEYLLNNLKDAEYFKVGMEAFYTFGPSIIERLKSNGKRVFLDLKLHDIPNTVAKSLKSLSKLEIDMINVHCLGGTEMMTKAKETLPAHIKLLGVTILTSHSEETLNKDFKQSINIKNNVLLLSELAFNSQLNGVVCSAQEASTIKEKLGNKFLTVTPGIRLESDNRDDQKRVVTPKIAFNNGSDYIVMGRSITQSISPNKTFLKIIEGLK